MTLLVFETVLLQNKYYFTYKLTMAVVYLLRVALFALRHAQSASRVIATVNRLSVCPNVCSYISWNT